jgi:SNF2 family DNA or RNA helicase
MLKAKQELQDLTISVGEKWISNLSDEELENLLK